MGKRRSSSSRRINRSSNLRSNRRSKRVKRGKGSRIKRNSRKKGSLRPKRTKRIRRRNKIQVGGSKSPLSEAEELAAVRAEINALQGELSTEELQQAASARPVPSAIAVAESPSLAAAHRQRVGTTATTPLARAVATAGGLDNWHGMDAHARRSAIEKAMDSTDEEQAEEEAIAIAEPPAEGASDPYIKVEILNRSQSSDVNIYVKDIQGNPQHGGEIKLKARHAVKLDMGEGDVMTITTSLFSARFKIERKNGEIQKYVVEDGDETLRLTSDAHMVGFGTHKGVQHCSTGQDCRYPSGRRSHPDY